MRSAFLSLLLVACSTRAPVVETVDASPVVIDAAPVVVTPAQDAAPPTLTIADGSRFQADPKTARSIGHTSVVYKLALANGEKAVFKPASKRGPVRYRGEIAAYRLGVALGIPYVPRAFYRQMDAAVLGRAVGDDALFAEEVLRPVKGAVIPWIDDLDFLPLEKDQEWKTWLTARGAIPDDKKVRAAQISTLVVFDYLTGNWDRWSGGNVGLSKTTGDLIFIDNDGAFFEVVPKTGLDRNERLLRGVDRFSRAFIGAIRSVDLEKALGDETPGHPLLSEKALAGVAARRTSLLAIVDAKGDAALSFP